MKLITVVGARPQFIKAAVVSRAIEALRPDINELIIHTGQHYDINMSEVFFSELKIPHPSHNLGIGGGSHGQNTGRMLESIEMVMLREAPNMVLVYGDTDSTLAGALCAAKLNIPVAHVEAGLRSFNRTMPEELNRILSDHISTLLFAPTDTAVENLRHEGIVGDKVQQVGDVMYDAALYYGRLASTQSNILTRLDLLPRSYVLATIHRAENTGDDERLRNIFAGLGMSRLPVVIPIHPRTLKRIHDCSIRPAACIRLIDPVGYLDMIQLEKHAKLIATDSGGVQKEAYFHSVPCITLRQETEWIELLRQDANVLVGTDPELIAARVNEDRIPPAVDTLLFGDGRAGEAVVASLR